MAKIIDGKALAAKKQAALQEKVERLKAESGLVPGLVVILVGTTLPAKSMCEIRSALLKRSAF